MKISQFTQTVASFRTEFSEGLSICGRYRPDAYTPRLEASLMNLGTAQSPSSELAKCLAELLVDWDLQKEDGEPLKTTAKELQEIPLSILKKVFETISESVADPKATESVCGTS